jgi:hypothetical protein
MATSLPHPFPRLRWLGPLWLAVYLPAYSYAYGLTNFLFLCNIGVIVTAIGLWLGSRLLLSSQAVAAIFIGGVWTLDFGARLATGSHLLGVTAYMWDPQYPLATRLMSLYHVAWPLLLLACLARLGYDRRGWPLQSAIAATLIVLCRLATPPADNINYAFTDPLFGRQLGPPVVHVAIIVAAVTLGIYGSTHWALARRFAASGERSQPITPPAGRLADGGPTVDG